MTNMRVNRFPCGTATIEVTQQMDGISITKCVGPLPDKFRTMHYRPVVIHPDLPSGVGSNAGFEEFITALRNASEDDASGIVMGTIG